MDFGSTLNLDEGNNYKVFNSKSGMTFCVQVGKSENEHETKEREDSNEFAEILLRAPDKDIQVSKHEITEEMADLDHIDIGELGCDIVISDIAASSKDSAKSNFSDDFEFLELIPPLTSDFVSTSMDSPPTSKVKSAGNKNRISPVSNCNGKLMCNKQTKKSSPKSLGMRLMKDKDGRLVMKSFYQVASKKDSYTVEPSMLDRPAILTKKYEEFSPLQSLSLTYSSSGGLSFKSKNAKTSSSRSPASSRFPRVCLIKGPKELNDSEISVPSNTSQILHWEEGNIDQVKSYIGLSSRLQEKYFSPGKSMSHSSQDSSNVPDILSEFMADDVPTAPKNGAAPGYKVLLSWEAVEKRIEELQGETFTKYIPDYKAPSFKDAPAAFRKIHFSLEATRRDVDICIPHSGIPFIFLGIFVYACHLGKKKTKQKIIIDAKSKTKKIGCPAYVAIAKIARLPDYDISYLDSNCEKDVLAELKDTWDFNNSKVRYYYEYHMKEPSLDDHKGHEEAHLSNGTKFQEPVDIRILEKIRELARNGHTGIPAIQRGIRNYVVEELFKGDPKPPLDRRRYNPTPRDIRYALTKSKVELKKEGKSIIQIQCSNLINDISEAVKNVSQEEYLYSVKSHLSTLHTAIRDQEPLESVFQSNREPIQQVVVKNHAAPSQKQKKRKYNPDTILLEKDSCFNQIEQDKIIEQFYVNTDPSIMAQFFADQEFADISTKEMEALQTQEEVTEVYYYYPDGNCELANT